MVRREQRESFEGQVCLVTGGAQGIGWAIAQSLAREGARVRVCDVCDESLAAARAALRGGAWESRISFASCDVTDRDAVEAWISGIHREEGRIDVLVNNAAFVRWQSVADTSIEDAERALRVSYFGMVYCVKAALPLMQAAGRGAIVTMGSIAGRVYAGRASASYCAAKAAVEAYTRVLEAELSGSPIHVLLVRPAAVSGTNFFRRHVPSNHMPRAADFLPCLSPPEVAAAIIDGLRRRTTVLDIPGYSRALQVAFELAPGPIRRLFSIGGSGRRDYGAASWTIDAQ
jgi:NAD(P)-dependent dehydrogenase (short-subunit alcohol dehydrogenase family)